MTFYEAVTTDWSFWGTRETGGNAVDLRIAAFKEALDSFAYLARIDLAEIRQRLHDERLIDGFQNGRAQKLVRI